MFHRKDVNLNSTVAGHRMNEEDESIKKEKKIYRIDFEDDDDDE